MFLAEVRIFPGTNAEHGILGSEVKPHLYVVETSEGFHQRAVSVHGHNLAGSLPGRQLFDKHFRLIGIDQPLISTVVDLSI